MYFVKQIHETFKSEEKVIKCLKETKVAKTKYSFYDFLYFPLRFMKETVKLLYLTEHNGGYAHCE